MLCLKHTRSETDTPKISGKDENHEICIIQSFVYLSAVTCPQLGRHTKPPHWSAESTHKCFVLTYAISDIDHFRIYIHMYVWFLFKDVERKSGNALLKYPVCHFPEDAKISKHRSRSGACRLCFVSSYEFLITKVLAGTPSGWTTLPEKIPPPRKLSGSAHEIVLYRSQTCFIPRGESNH